MNKRRHRAIAKAKFYMEVHENKKYWAWRFNSIYKGSDNIE